MLKNEVTNRKTFVVLAIMLTAFVLIAVVIWVFDKKIDRIESQGQNAASVQSSK